MYTFASQTTSLTINFQSDENKHLQRGDKRQRLPVTLLRIKQCLYLHFTKCLLTWYVSWICRQIWKSSIFPVVSPAFRFWEDINFQAINFQIMKAKIITTICAVVGALALVFLPAEASTVGLQIIWSGSWLFVFLLCAKGIEKYGNNEQ